MAFEIETEKFEGPLDLMLHLIREQQLDIFDLDMDVLTDQYIEYLNKMERLQIDVESEYLVELSILIEYKSKKLLPKPSEDIESDYEDDPKERLIKRLIEYQKYKEVSKELDELYNDRLCEVSKPLSIDDNMRTTVSDSTAIDGSPYDLQKAMERVLRRLILSKPIETKFTRKELSTEDRVLQIKARLASLPETFSFETLVDDCHDIHEYIVSFLAILDMAKNHLLSFVIDDEDEIIFSKGVIDEQ